MTHENPAQPQWTSVAAELQAYREAQQRTWGNVDNTQLACYLAGEIDSGERSNVESALQAHPELQNLADLVREVLDEFEHEEVEPSPPPVLKFQPKASYLRNRWRQLGSLAAAAALLMVLGLGLIGPDKGNNAPSGKNDLRAEVSTQPPSVERDGVADRRGRLRESLNRIDPEDSPEATVLALQPVLADTTISKSDSELWRQAQVKLLTAYEHTVERKRDVRFNVKPKSMHLSVPTRSFGHARAVRGGNNPYSGQDPKYCLESNVGYLVQGAKETRCPSTYNRYAWTLANLDPQLKSAIPQQQRATYRRALKHYQECKPMWTGIKDEQKVLSPATREMLNCRIHQLAKEQHVNVVSETLATLPPHEMQQYQSLSKPVQKRRYLHCLARQRSREVGACKDKDVFVYVCLEPRTMEVVLGSKVSRNSTWADLASVAQWEVPSIEPLAAESAKMMIKLGSSASEVLQQSFGSLLSH